ncbi:Rieske (2Fe-2S) protein [Halomarina oriensis]|uniref:Rieske (2Fe-2S) protein n=1 Tax=Halomarina oriensis TaxID=671145 RepID=A0A6B0GNR2_9EURY|nr:Rieske (2Fe-2S) protein [Halomarina oriensis]MWG35227.1 Rieske (2Fe-2S) protein [Halomarina oriensis]
MDEDRRIASVSEVPTDSTLLFTIRDGVDREEVILVRLGGEGDGPASDDDADAGDAIHAWKNYCQHWTDVRLDKGSGAAVRDVPEANGVSGANQDAERSGAGEILCQRHAATFEKDSGLCTYGPCEGAYLEAVAVTVHEDAVYLDEPEYEFDGLGPSGDHDLSSGGRIDF